MTAADLLHHEGEEDASGVPGANPSAGINVESFQPGVSVLHPEYGLGRLTAIEGAGPNRKGRVSFTLAGEKTFILARSPLRVVNRR